MKLSWQPMFRQPPSEFGFLVLLGLWYVGDLADLYARAFNAPRRRLGVPITPHLNA